MDKSISEFDIAALASIRSNVELFMQNVASNFASNLTGGERLLDIAPQDHSGAKPFFNSNIIIETLDIAPDSKATYIADLCCCAEQIGPEKFDYIVCTEVLEHTRQPFNAVENIYYMLKQGGLAFISTPYNFRIHGPLPDCWRFTEYGLQELFKKFEIIELTPLETETRWLMPLQYTLVAKKL
jgi:SAM-dependent methyltransferase